MIQLRSLSQPRISLEAVLDIPITDRRKAASFPSMPQRMARSYNENNQKQTLLQHLHTTVYTYGTLNPMLVRKLLVAYIMKIGSLKRLKSNIWCKILACLESALIQQMLDWDSVSDGDNRTSSLQSSIERRYCSGSVLQKRYRIEF